LRFKEKKLIILLIFNLKKNQMINISHVYLPLAKEKKDSSSALFSKGPALKLTVFTSENPSEIF